MTEESSSSVMTEAAEYILNSEPFKFLFKNSMCLFTSRFIELIAENMMNTVRFAAQDNYTVSKILSVEFVYLEFMWAVPSGFFIVMQYYYSFFFSVSDKENVQKLRSDFMIILVFMFIISVVLMCVFIVMPLDWMPCESDETGDIRPLVCYFVGAGFVIASLSYLQEQIFFIEHRYLLVFCIGLVIGIGLLSIEAIAMLFRFHFSSSWYQLVANIIVYTAVSVWVTFLENGHTVLGVKNKEQFVGYCKPVFRKKDGEFKELFLRVCESVICSFVSVTGPVGMLVTLQTIGKYRDRMSDDDYRMQRNAMFVYCITGQLFKVAPWTCENVAAKVIVICEQFKSYKRFVELMVRALLMGVVFNVLLFLIISFTNASGQLYNRFPGFEDFFGSAVANKMQLYSAICGSLECFEDVMIVMHLHERKYVTIASMAIIKYAFGLVMIKMCANVSHENTKFYMPIICMEFIGGVSAVPMFAYDIYMWTEKGNKKGRKNKKARK